MIGRRLRAVRGRRALVVALLVAGLVAAGTTAFAASLTVTSSRLTAWHSSTVVVCAAGTVTVSANADSYVDEGAAGSNFGSASDLKVRSALLLGLLGKRWTLVRFPLPDTPPLCSVTSVTLRLFAHAVSGATRTLSVQGLDAAWQEGTVTWNNAPDATGTAVTTSSGAGYRTWNVTSLYAVAANGFFVRDLGGGLLTAAESLFNTRTAGSNTPELLVTFG